MAKQRSAGGGTTKVRAAVIGDNVPADLAAQWKAADKLQAVAERTIEKAQKEVAAPRLMNTERRARLGGGVVDRAQQDIADARTALKIAEALRSGEAGALANVKSLADIRELRGLAREAEYATDRKLGRGWKEGGHGLKPDDVANLGGVKGFARIDTNDMARLRAATTGVKGVAGDLKVLERYAASTNRGDRYSYETSDSRVFEALRNVSNAVLKNKSTAWAKYPHEVTSAKWQARKYLESARDFDRAKGVAGVSAESRQAALRAFLDVRAGKTAADPVKAAERSLLGLKLPGFFPTPEVVAKRMAEIAGIRPGMTVLEPSAGTGRLADAAKAAGGKVDAVEMQSRLRDILTQKGHALIEADFTAMKPEGKYDRVLMNPPFEKGQDMAHVRRAYEHLKPGGKMVAIMGEGGFSRSDKNAAGFRQWLQSVGGTSEKLPEGTFKESNTGVNTRLVTIEKPAAQPKPPAGWSDAARTASAEVRKANAKPVAAVASAVERALATSAARNKVGSTLAPSPSVPAKAAATEPAKKKGRAAKSPVPPPETVSRTDFMAQATVSAHPEGGHVVKGPGLPEVGLRTATTGTATAAKTVAYSKARSGTAKALGFLAPVAIAAAAVTASNEARAAGRGAAGQLAAGAKEGAKATATLGGFMVAQTAGTVALVKGAGLTVAKAIPAVNLAMMVGGAIHGALTAKPGERLAGAARGAWDMSLPGGVVNTGLAVREAAAGMRKAYDVANAQYQTAAPTEPTEGKRKGWSNASRIAAAKARGASNLPYGGQP